jgi:hypothetical protein
MFVLFCLPAATAAAAFEKTKQQHEALTLSDISPKWAKRLGEQQQLPVPLSITWLRWWFEIIYPPKCVVGEAHGFTRSYTYNCGECGKIGNKFSLYFTLHLSSKLEENKQGFVDHWNKEHTKFLTSWGDSIQEKI